MPQFLMLDPIARDYIFQNGSPMPTDDISLRGYFDISIPKNNWLYGRPNQGSLLYTLANKKRTAVIEKLFSSYVEDAITQQSIAQGYAAKVTITNSATTSTATNNEIQIIPTTVPVTSQFDFVSV